MATILSKGDELMFAEIPPNPIHTYRHLCAFDILCIIIIQAISIIKQMA